MSSLVHNDLVYYVIIIIVMVIKWLDGIKG